MGLGEGASDLLRLPIMMKLHLLISKISSALADKFRTRDELYKT
jgi:hypothetical protein